MRTAFTCVLVISLISLIAGPVWSSGVPPRWSSWFSAQGLQIVPTPAQTPLFQTTVTQTSSTLPVAPANVRNLALDTEWPGTQGILASTTWLKGAFAAETEWRTIEGKTAFRATPTPTRQSHDAIQPGCCLGSGPLRHDVSDRRPGFLQWARPIAERSLGRMEAWGNHRAQCHRATME